MVGYSENNLSRGGREGRASSVFSIKESTAAAAAAEWRYGAAVGENRFCGTGRRHQLAGGCEGGRVAVASADPRTATQSVLVREEGERGKKGEGIACSSCATAAAAEERWVFSKQRRRKRCKGSKDEWPNFKPQAHLS